jgi:hypothetical protein
MVGGPIATEGAGVARGCEIIYGREAADVIQAEFERLEGGPCPCRVGNACPMFPRPKARAALTEHEA